MKRFPLLVLIVAACWFLDWRRCLPRNVRWTLPPYDPTYPELRILRCCRWEASGGQSAVLTLAANQNARQGKRRMRAGRSIARAKGAKFSPAADMIFAARCPGNAGLFEAGPRILLLACARARGRRALHTQTDQP